MRIGPYDIAAGAVLAPMAGITDPPFRMLCREMGASLTVTELVSAHALVFLSSEPTRRLKPAFIKILALTKPFPGESPFAVQLFGDEPAQMAEAAQYLESQGAEIIDLNFGCPARKVVKNGEGAGVALMLDPKRLTQIAAAVVRAINIPVTAKIRVGWSKETRNAPEVARRLEDAGIAAICVHARTRDQIHSGPVDLETLAAACQAVRIPIIGNGGIKSLEDAARMIERTGCARVAVGQAARGNPWIFSAFLGKPTKPSLFERIEVLKQHLRLFADWAGEQRAAVEMRKHASWYLKGFSGAAAVRQRLAEAVTFEAFLKLLAEIHCGDDS